MKDHERSFKYFDDIINHLFILSHLKIENYLFKM
jgi:hypothetical protein